MSPGDIKTTAVIQATVFIDCHLPYPVISYARHEGVFPPTRFPVAGNVLLTAAESLNENDLSPPPLADPNGRIETNRRARQLCNPIPPIRA